MAAIHIYNMLLCINSSGFWLAEASSPYADRTVFSTIDRWISNEPRSLEITDVVHSINPMVVSVILHGIERSLLVYDPFLTHISTTYRNTVLTQGRLGRPRTEMHSSLCVFLWVSGAPPFTAHAESLIL